MNGMENQIAWGDRVISWAGLLLHIAVAVFPFAATGLLAPLYGVALAYLGWAAGVFLIIRWWNRLPKHVLLVPVMAIAWWFGLMLFGDFVLGWTA